MFLFKAAVTEIDRLRCQSMVDTLTRELECKVEKETKQLDGKNPLEMFAQWEEEILQKYDKAMLPSASETSGNDKNSDTDKATAPCNEKPTNVTKSEQIEEKEGEEEKKRTQDTEEEEDENEFTQVRIRRRILSRNIAKQRVVFLQKCGVDVSEDGHVVEEMPPPTNIPDENMKTFRERLIFDNPGSSTTDEFLEQIFGSSRRFIKSETLSVVYRDSKKPSRSRSKSGGGDLDTSTSSSGSNSGSHRNKDIQKRVFYLLSGILVITIPLSDGKYLFNQLIDLKGSKIKCEDFHGLLNVNDEVNDSTNASKVDQKDIFINRFKIYPAQGSKIEVQSTCVEEQDAWLRALNAAICDCVDLKHRQIGWRHKVRLGTIHAAVLSQDIKLIEKYKEYCELGKLEYSIFDMMDEDGFAPIHYASMIRNTEVTRILIEVGVDVTIKDLHGSSPLHWSCLRLDHVNLATLCGGIFDTDHVDDRGNTPLYIACLAGRNENNEVDMGALLKCIEILTSLGADANYRDSQGNSLVQYALYNWQTEVVDALVNAGADIVTGTMNTVNNCGPLQVILREEPLECNLYFNRSRLPGSIINNGEVVETAEEALAKRNPLNCLKTLTRFLEKSTRYLNSKNQDGNSLLEQVVRNASVYGEEIGSILQMLVSMGARAEEASSLVAISRQSLNISNAVTLGKEIWSSKGVLDIEEMDVDILKIAVTKEDNSNHNTQDSNCQCCGCAYTLFKRKFLCIQCKQGVCNECSLKKVQIVNENYYPGSTETKYNQERVCDECYNRIFSLHETEESRRQREREMIEKLSVGRLSSPQEDAQKAATATRNNLFATSKAVGSGSSSQQQEEKSMAQKLLETTGMSALMSTLGEAQDQLRQRGQKLEDLGEKTERLAMNANEFEKLAKRLNEERSSWW